MNRPNILLWAPFVSLFHREVKRIARTSIQTIVVPIVSSSLYLIIFGIHLGSSLELTSADSYLAFLLPGVVMMGSLLQAYANSTSSIMQMKYIGELQDLKVAPLSEAHIVLALGLAGMFRGVIVGFHIFLVGQVIYFSQEGSFLEVQYPLWGLVFSFLGSWFFANLGIVIGFYSKNLEQMGAITGFLMQPLLYLGGVFYSLDKLHVFWKTVSEFNPVVYLINGMRYAFLGKSDFTIEVSFFLTLGLLLAMFLIAYTFVKKSPYVRPG